MIELLLPWLVAASVASAEPESPAELAPVTVVASKFPRPVADVAGSVTVLRSEQWDDDLAHGIADLTRHEPGLSVIGVDNRFGAQGFNVRGIDGNRVALEIDGVPLADQFDIGSYSNAGRDAVDVSILDRVEILRGPASTLYGSDAIGGVVAYFTRDPQDLVSRNGEPAYSFRSEYHGVDDAIGTTLTGAHAGSEWGGLFSLVRRSGHELDRSAGTAGDRNDHHSESAFLKLTHDGANDGTLRMTADLQRRHDLTELGAVLGTGRFRSTTALRGDDTSQRDRFSVDYRFDPAFGALDEAQILVYAQQSETDQFTVEERAGSGFNRERRFLYEQRVGGLELNLSQRLDIGGLGHRLGYGLEWIRTRTEERRDGLQIDRETGATTSTMLGEQFPVRDFPNTTTRETGLYLQDEIRKSGSDWTVIPALRYDHHRLDPSPDRLYREDFPDTEVVAVSESEFSPKLGVLYQASANTQWFVQFAHGFRSPPFEDVNIGLDIPLFNIRALPNPDLRSESSDGIEWGLRYAARGTRVNAAVFYTDYEDFIETKVALGPDPVSGVLLFQSQNIAEARIYGAEFRITQSLGDWLEALAPFELEAGASWTRGKNEVSGEGLNSLQPDEALLGLRWQDPDRPLSAQLWLRAVGSPDDLDDSRGELYVPAGYGVVDLTARYQPLPSTVLRAGVFNLGDRKYWRWSEVRGLGPGDPLLAGLSAPGRNLAVSLTVSW